VWQPLVFAQLDATGDPERPVTFSGAPKTLRTSKNEFYMNSEQGAVHRMKRAAEFRTEARRLRHAFGRLTEPSLNRAMSSASPAIQRNIDHCRSMLAKGIDDGANRQLVETLLRYMETSFAGAGRSASDHQHDALQAWVTADEKRLKIVARALRGHGLRTISYLRELADIAKNAGDQSSADAWQELADAAERIIRISSSGE